MSFALIGTLLFLFLFDASETITCPPNYVSIAMGCYKINNGINLTWSDAREYCHNESAILATLSNFVYVSNSTTHLLALELEMENTALINWIGAYQLQSQFWIDGIVSSSTWNWSNQSITWYFDSNEDAVIGNGSNYKFAYNSNVSTYQIADDVKSKPLNFICEYQVLCNKTNGCQNNATCYLNIGQELCLCAPGFTGLTCETEIDECLSSPCEHGGSCIDAINNYICNCSQIFFSGSNCQTSTGDPTQGDRSKAFWAMVGVVSSLIVILTLSDLPWEDMVNAIGCSCFCFKSCSKQDDDNKNMREKILRLSDLPANDHSSGEKKISMPGETTSKGMNYHVINTVWNPEHTRNESSLNPQYNGYRSPDQRTTPDNALIQSFGAVAMTKQQQKELEEKRVYAININEPTKSEDPVDTMVSWTQQLQEQLRNKTARETSASSTKQLIHSSNDN